MNLEIVKFLASISKVSFTGICHVQAYPKINLHCCEDKHNSQIDRNDGLKEERLEVDCDVAHHVEQDRRQVDCQDAA